MMTIKELRAATGNGAACEATIAAQVESLTRKETAAGKPYYELVLRDATGTLTLRAWNDRPAFALCQELTAGSFVKIF
ncbi:MAG: hypothetical protein FJ390_04595, partial [Verrucomicrobia bacterium]|nr:hypothetical protein [Verrucomicrobiota bacterium]